MALSNCNDSTATTTTTTITKMTDYELASTGGGGGGGGEAGDGGGLYHLNGTTVEVVVLFLVLVAWVLSVAIFLHRWRHLRILPPRALLFKDSPKNLDRVKVVDSPADSVIYRGYPKGIVSTLQARFNRLRRTFSLRLANLPLAMASVRARTSLGRQSCNGRPSIVTRHSYYGRQSRDGHHLCDGNPSCDGCHSYYGRSTYDRRPRVSSLYRTSRCSMAAELAPLTPEVMESIPEVNQSTPEVAESIPKVTESIPEVMLKTPIAMQPILNNAIARPEVVMCRPEAGHYKPEVITSLAEVVIEYAHESTLRKELNSSP